jgi:hypothetical protein
MTLLILLSLPLEIGRCAFCSVSLGFLLVILILSFLVASITLRFVCLSALGVLCSEVDLKYVVMNARVSSSLLNSLLNSLELS